MKRIIVIGSLATVLSACNSNPDDLAKEYCNCRHDLEKGLKSEKDCAELAESHTLRLQDEAGALEAYASKVMDCLSRTELKKEK